MNENKANWHLVLFADGSYDLRAAGKRLKKQADALGIFASITLNNRKSLAKNHRDFYLTNRDFISKNRQGYGKWIWKPYLILSKLKDVGDQEGVIYLDCGCYLNLETEKARERLLDYFRLAQEHDSLAMQLYDFEFSSHDLSDRRHSKPFLQEFPAISDETFKTNQIQAGIVFLIKNESNIDFVSKWHNLSLRYNKMLSDETYLNRFNVSIEDYRWDQSIFSLLYKESKMFSLQDETWFYPNWCDGENYPIWAMRWKKGEDPFRFDSKDISTIIISYVLSIITRVLASARYRICLLLQNAKRNAI